MTIRDLPGLYFPSQINTRLGLEDSKTLYLRQSVAEMLREAIGFLPDGYSFLLIEDYRTYDYQKKIFDDYLNKIISENPDLSLDKCREMTQKFVSDPDVYSPHVTGGAVDIAIVDSNLMLLDFGNLFTYDETAETDYPYLTEKQKPTCRYNRKGWFY